MTIDDGELSGCQGDPCIQGKVENTETCHLGDRLLTPQAACLQLGGGSRRVIMCRWQLPPLAAGHDRSGVFKFGCPLAGSQPSCGPTGLRGDPGPTASADRSMVLQ